MRVAASRPTVMLDAVAVVSIGLGPVRIGGPVSALVQRVITDRYARALAE